MPDRKPNFLVRSLNLDVFGVLRPHELFAKALFDAMAVCAIGNVVYELATGPTPYFFNGVRDAFIVTGCDLFLNYTNRRYWTQRLTSN